MKSQIWICTQLKFGENIEMPLQHHWKTFTEWTLHSGHVVQTKQPVILKALPPRYMNQSRTTLFGKNHSQPRISSCQRSTCRCCSRGEGSRGRRRQPHGTCSWPHQSLRGSASCFLQRGWPGKEQCLEGGTSPDWRHISPWWASRTPMGSGLKSECGERQKQKGGKTK